METFYTILLRMQAISTKTWKYSYVTFQVEWIRLMQGWKELNKKDAYSIFRLYHSVIRKIHTAKNIIVTCKHATNPCSHMQCHPSNRSKYHLTTVVSVSHMIFLHSMQNIHVYGLVLMFSTCQSCARSQDVGQWRRWCQGNVQRSWPSKLLRFDQVCCWFCWCTYPRKDTFQQSRQELIYQNLGIPSSCR